MHIPRVTSRVVRVLVGLSVACALLPAGNVLADDGQPAGDPQPGQLDGSEPLPAKPKYPRLGSDLSRLAKEVDRVVEALEGEPPPEQYLRVPVTIRGTYNVSSTVALLESGGARVANIGHEYIEAIVPVTLLVRLGSHEGVTRVETIVPPEPDVTSEGAAVHRSPVWNARGYTGAGVKVGIIDVGFVGFGGLMGAELPSSVVARCYTAIGVFSSTLADCETDSVHGTAVAEAVVDMAPDVSLYIANPQSFSDLQNTASWMVSQGVEVINHSVGWIWNGPGDGSSPFSNSPLRTVDEAVTGGAVWLNAAGNEAEGNWFGGYADSDGDDFLEFTAGVELNRVDLSAGEGITAQLRWDDAWGGAAKDFDLLLYNASLNLVASSIDEQSGAAGHYPREVFQYVAPSTGAYYLAIGHSSGAVPSWLHMGTLTDQAMSVAVAATSVGNPAESANTGMLAVGAADWRTPNTIESFSSRGPTIDGRTKPELVGTDRGDSASYGPLGFAGTSQASPHVAGLAALVAQQFPDLTPAQVADYLKSNALPRGTVPNDTWGYGLAELPSLTPGPPTNVAAESGDGKATVTWSAPAADGGSTITQYMVTSNPAAATTTVDGSTLSATVTGLSNRTSYTFTVVAVNAVGSSSPSAASNAVTPVSLTPVPVPAAQVWALLVLAAAFAAILVVRGRRQPRRTLR